VPQRAEHQALGVGRQRWPAQDADAQVPISGATLDPHGGRQFLETRTRMGTTLRAPVATSTRLILPSMLMRMARPSGVKANAGVLILVGQAARHRGDRREQPAIGASAEIAHVECREVVIGPNVGQGVSGRGHDRSDPFARFTESPVRRSYQTSPET
jgi:hypothetical protein